MAMLAEPRRKVRYTINPSGKGWVQAQAQQGGGGEGGGHFGQRMLLNMGWREGQGLGKTGQGAPEPIRVKRKSDQRGVGCTGAYAAETMPQSVDFAGLLSQLNATHCGGGYTDAAVAADSPPPVVGLEAKSRASRARLHYHKFTRGKDVSAYDSRSLACIFGSRVDSREVAGGSSAESDGGDCAGAVGLGFCDNAAAMKQSRSEASLQQKQGAEQPSDKHGLHLVQSQTSVQDYFRVKMLAVMQQRRQTQQQEEETWTSESSCSAASTAAAAVSVDDEAEARLAAASPAGRTTKRARFRLSPSPPPPPPPPPPPRAVPDFELVVDFGLFPGGEFQRVLGYRFY